MKYPVFSMLLAFILWGCANSHHSQQLIAYPREIRTTVKKILKENQSVYVLERSRHGYVNVKYVLFAYLDSIQTIDAISCNKKWCYLPDSSFTDQQILKQFLNKDLVTENELCEHCPEFIIWQFYKKHNKAIINDTLIFKGKLLPIKTDKEFDLD